MASDEGTVIESTSPNGETKSFQQRLADIPVYTMTLSQLQGLYSTLKERNEVLKTALTTGEGYVESLANATKPVVVAATNSALSAVKPLVGEVSDPIGAIDSCASEALAKVQEKLPFVMQTPAEIADAAKSYSVETANYYINKAQGSTLGKQVVKQTDNAVSFSELMVEICFPTDGSNPDDLKELEKAEEDEDKGLTVRAGNLKDRAIRRGKRKLMAYKPVRVTIDTVQYAQQQMFDMTEKLKQGTNYITEKSSDVKDVLVKNYPELKGQVQTKLGDGRKLIGESWDHVYTTTMYIPKKALQISGEVYVSAQEIVFAYTKAHSITEMPHAVAEMAESYYKNLNVNSNLENVKEKAFAFVYVPAQVVSDYLQSSRFVQWIVPKSVEMETLQVVETEMDEIQAETTSETEDTPQKDIPIETEV